MTLTLAAVFAPLGFISGNTGKLFTEFALTVTSAVLVSGFVALTLTPMMCSLLLKEHESHGGLYLAMERFFHGMTEGYRGSLRKLLSKKSGRLAIGIAFLAVGPLGAVNFKL